MNAKMGEPVSPSSRHFSHCASKVGHHTRVRPKALPLGRIIYSYIDRPLAHALDDCRHAVVG